MLNLLIMNFRLLNPVRVLSGRYYGIVDLALEADMNEMLINPSKRKKEYF